jgi:DNA-binding MarR family transcriptional regulator
MASKKTHTGKGGSRPFLASVEERGTGGSEEERVIARRLARVCDDLIMLNKDLTVQQLLILLDIATHEGTPIVALAERIDSSLAATSRTIDILSSWGRRHKKRMGLVERREVPSDRRVRELFLTRRGHKVLAQITGTMGG